MHGFSIEAALPMGSRAHRLCVCSRARNENEVRETLAKVWGSPTTAKELLAQLANKNADIFEFEKVLEHNVVQQTSRTKLSVSTA